LLLKANLRHDITQEVAAEGLESQALSSDLRRKWTGGLHMLGSGNQASAERREARVPQSAFTSQRVMKAMPLLTKIARAVCFPAS